MSAPTEIQKLVDLIDPHADELDDRDANKIFDAARRVHNAGYRPAGAETSAFPTYLGNRENWDLGMTLRDYFAVKALVGIMSGQMVQSVSPMASLNGMPPTEMLARAAYQFADAMLEERKR